MARTGAMRLNVTLDPEYAEKLARLAERTRTQEGTLARSLLSHALDEADLDPRHAVDLLDGIPAHGGAARRTLGRSPVPPRPVAVDADRLRVRRRRGPGGDRDRSGRPLFPSAPTVNAESRQRRRRRFGRSPHASMRLLRRRTC